jgi:hypothetical protein
VKRDLKDWSITKDLPLDRREWKLAIHVSEPWSSVPSLLLPFCQFFFSFYSPFFAFLWLSVFFLFLFGFLSPFISPLLFHPCFVSVFWLMRVSSLAYPNLLETKRLGCCCCNMKKELIMFGPPWPNPFQFPTNPTRLSLMPAYQTSPYRVKSTTSVLQKKNGCNKSRWWSS